ncbi:hypothetical protein OAC65_00075 [bacterium]|nr:hypothetical protein [bacterium]
MDSTTIAILAVIIGGIIIFYVIKVANKQPLNNDSIDKVADSVPINENADSKQKISAKQSPSKTSSQFNFINYTNERNAFWLKFYPTSRTLYKIFEVLNIIAFIILVIIIVFVFTSDFGVVGIPIVIATAFSVISFFLFKEMLLFQVDKNFLIYKQSEKYLQ